MRIKVMPLMRSWVTKPNNVVVNLNVKSAGEFAALGNLSTTDAEEVYVTYEVCMPSSSASLVAHVDPTSLSPLIF